MTHAWELSNGQNYKKSAEDVESFVVTERLVGLDTHDLLHLFANEEKIRNAESNLREDDIDIDEASSSWSVRYHPQFRVRLDSSAVLLAETSENPH